MTKSILTVIFAYSFLLATCIAAVFNLFYVRETQKAKEDLDITLPLFIDRLLNFSFYFSIIALIISLLLTISIRFF